MTVPVVPFVQVPSLWVVFGPATALSMLAGYVLARVESRPRIGGAGQITELGPEHFDSAVNKRLVAVVLGVEEPDAELKPLVAELDARADAEGIDEQTAEQLLLRVRERRLAAELADAEDERLPDLQQALAKVRERIREFA